jgi:RecA-family ATPase
VAGLSTFDAFLDRDEKAEPWLIPGLLCRSWRALIVAPEGAGKSMVARALVMGAAQGIGPFGGSSYEPVRTLMVDCENPDGVVRATCRPIRAAAKMNAADYADWRGWLWHQPGGLNLRTRTDRANFERVLAASRPDVVCAGPIYKLYRTGRDNDEQATLDVLQMFDELRTRYGFALVLEHHAPKGQGASNIRELVPYGSSLWLRWPELGLKLIPSQSTVRSTWAGSVLIGWSATGRPGWIAA